MDIKQEKEILTDPYAMFMYAIKSPLTRKKYEGRLAKFFNFIGMAGETLEGHCAAFEQKSRADPEMGCFYDHRISAESKTKGRE